MKNFIKRVIQWAVRRDAYWNILEKTFVWFGRYLQWERDRTGMDVAENVRLVAADLVVKHGPFKGMKYPESVAVGSSLFPKFLGSYERELAPLVERIAVAGYTDIVDVGCAEGYYAVGLAMRIKEAKVYAYDTDNYATELCMKMATVNGVNDRLVIGEFCDDKELMNIPFKKKALIVSDCEGYEKELFTKEVTQFLAPHDVLIEVHDFIDLEISGHLRKVFADTHNIEVIKSLDDLEKVWQYEYPELEGLSLAKRRELLAENRGGIMEWFYFTAKQPNV